MSYYTIELQSPGGIIATEYTSAEFDDPQAEAEAAYHTVLAAAAKSSVPYHGCMLVNSDGDVEKKEFYNRRGAVNNG